MYVLDVTVVELTANSNHDPENYILRLYCTF